MMALKRLSLLPAAVFCLIIAICPLPAVAQKVALVIGMAQYRHIEPLDNTIADARGVADVLGKTGFEVTLALDAPLAELRATLERFAFEAETADLAIIYFAGHGVEVQGQNFLIPVDADVKSNRDIQAGSLSLADFEAAVDRARRMGLVMLDSCRNNPFGDAILDARARDEGVAANGRSAAPSGMAPTDPDRGTVVFYAQRDGQVALDGVDGHSPFARALIDNLGEPGLEIGVMMRQVRDEVMRATNNLQEPYSYGSLPGTPFYIAGPRDGEADVAAAADRADGWAILGNDQEAVLATLAEAGDTRSLLGLGYIRMNTADPSFDTAAARDYFQRAADLGSAEAQFELARMMEKGIGGPADPEGAYALYRRSAEQGYGNALNEMGYIHYHGLFGLKPSMGAAIGYFTLAAAERDPEAEYNLAALIDDGVVSGRGPVDAAKLLYQALRSGNRQVLDVVPIMEEQFEPETLKALQDILREKGFYDGKSDGKIGPGTAAAMRSAFGLKNV